MRTRRISAMVLISLILSLLLSGCGFIPPEPPVSPDDIPAYSGAAYIKINGGEPFFTAEEMVTDSYERYTELDSLGRCGVATACIGVDIMPDKEEERGSLSNVSPSGWEHNGASNNINYGTELIDNGYLYNRCHLIGYQLTGENANEKNLITGTRYLNIEGMLPFENMVAAYVRDSENHVMYRVTPIFRGDNLVADGVLMEGISVEDDGAELKFCIFAYNVQPGIYIDYFNGTNRLADSQPPQAEEGESPSAPDAPTEPEEPSEPEEGAHEKYVLNTSSKKFHKEDCRYAESIKEENRGEFVGDKQELLDGGYSACGSCKP